MAQSAPLLLRLLASSVTAAARAGKIIRDVMSRGDLGIVEKSVNDLQTEADRSAQRCIVASLSRQYPDVHLIGEEGATFFEVPSDWVVEECDKNVLTKDCPTDYLTTNSEDIVVWIDPLDGTSEYTQGLLEHVTVLVGLAVKGIAVGGVIHQPYYRYKEGNEEGRTIWGLIGLGVGGLEPELPPAGKLIITTSRSHSNQLVEKSVNALKPDEILRVGGAGHKVLLLLEGKAHAYIFASRGCKKWDTCAPEAVLHAAGGKLTDMRGEFYKYDRDVAHSNKEGVFATAIGIDHSSLLNKLPQEVKNASF